MVDIAYLKKFATQVRRDILRMVHGPQSGHPGDRKSTRLNSSHSQISYAVFCLSKKRVLCFSQLFNCVPSFSSVGCGTYQGLSGVVVSITLLSVSHLQH